MAPNYIAPPGDPLSTPRKCILIVEDELLIRVLVADELRDAGYDVIEACNADEALTILRSSMHIDLILSDVRMPGAIDGIGLLGIVKETLPSLPVIITSGHLEPAHAMSRGANQFLPKPCPMEWVVKAVHAQLARD